MTASILTQALQATLQDLAVGMFVVVAAVLFVIARAQKDGPPRSRPEPVEPVQTEPDDWLAGEKLREFPHPGASLRRSPILSPKAFGGPPDA